MMPVYHVLLAMYKLEVNFICMSPKTVKNVRERSAKNIPTLFGQSKMSNPAVYAIKMETIELETRRKRRVHCTPTLQIDAENFSEKGTKPHGNVLRKNIPSLCPRKRVSTFLAFACLYLHDCSRRCNRHRTRELSAGKN